ncbi:MAG: hypothetical protein KDC38_12065 [Planctomycetes bacterium]|nr:hypothetical protein [Planctomycetota bacterium]
MGFEREYADQLFMDLAGRDRVAESNARRTSLDRRWELDSSPERLCRRLDELEVTSELRDVHLFAYIRSRARAEQIDDLTRLAEVLESRAVQGLEGENGVSVPLRHLRVLEAHWLHRRGRYREALRRLEAEIPRIQRAARSAYADFVHVDALIELGACFDASGNLFQTELCYRQALRIASRRGFFKRYEVESCLARALWSSGQHHEALDLHLSPEARAVASEMGEVHFLVDSQLDATKCAIEIGQAELARTELTAATRLIESHSELRGAPRGYAILYEGELATLSGDVERALDLLSRAVSHFEHLHVPCYPGAIQAKTSLCHYALFEGDVRLASVIIRKLLAEADQRECMEARSRLLLLESYLYLTDVPPDRASFEDLLRRLHLIHNPALLFHALGNLYAYALEFLEEPVQAFLLARIRNLRPLLKKSCYRDLYANYVTKRYEYAIENRLARYLQNDLEGEWDRIEVTG